jgi:hypothetical protein
MMMMMICCGMMGGCMGMDMNMMLAAAAVAACSSYDHGGHDHIHHDEGDGAGAMPHEPIIQSSIMSCMQLIHADKHGGGNDIDGNACGDGMLIII